MRAEQDPQVGPPPRVVEPWTCVAGHEIIRRPGGRSVCSCGQWAHEGPGNHRAEVDEHKRTAWPILVPRLPDESRQDWQFRVTRARQEALLLRERIVARDGLDRPTLPGEPFPLLRPDYADAEDRIVVLEWQLERIQLGPVLGSQ